MEDHWGNKYQEEKSSTKGNAVAINIDDFKEKTIQSKGFYIGRYEARTSAKRTGQTTDLPKMTLKPNDYVYDYVTQPQASQIARQMYASSQAYTCDLANSYAWDTATVFFQEFGGNQKYASTHIGTDMDSCDKGTSASDYTDSAYTDKICNVYDMACNRFEWTTETSLEDETRPCTLRAGSMDTYRPADRKGVNNTTGKNSHSFRPILYVSPDAEKVEKTPEPEVQLEADWFYLDMGENGIGIVYIGNSEEITLTKDTEVSMLQVDSFDEEEDSGEVNVSLGKNKINKKISDVRNDCYRG